MPSPPDTSVDQKIPLVVDLDGTLLNTDMLWEHLARAVRKNPFLAFAALLWWTRGRAFLKQQLARHVSVDPTILPYNEPFLAWLREQKAAGRKLILATASDRQMAQPVADHVKLFDEVLASDGNTNLRSHNKLDALVKKYGERGFDYAGNSSPDVAVWKGAREAIVVNASDSLRQKAARIATIGRTFPRSSGILPPLIRCLRPHQWVKNFIIFVPVLAAHKLNQADLLVRDLWAFAAFCICASGVYVINDIVDLDADRQHSGKNSRPMASGALPLPVGLAVGPVLAAVGLLVAFHLSWLFAGVTGAYLLLTTSYSLWVKRIALLDVFFLAGLYTIRLVAGHAATEIVYSSWLLMFSMFIFLSLALVKRYVELAESGQPATPGRGYVAGDLEIVASLGTGSGYLAALVLALYVNSEQVTILYAHPHVLLLICPLLLYWVSRTWLLAHRKQLHDDPVFFAVKDPASYVVGILVLAVLWLATGS